MSTLSPISVSFDDKGLPELRHETSAEIPDLNVTTALTCEKDEPSTSASGHYSSESDQNEVDSSSPDPTARFQLNPYYKKSRLLSQKCSISSPRSAGNHGLPSINKSSSRTYLDPASPSSTSPGTKAQDAMSRNTPSPASISPGSNLSNVSPDFHSPSLSEATQPIMATPTPSMSDKTQSAPATPGHLPCNSLSVSSAAPRPSSVTPIPHYNSPMPNYDPTSPSYDPTSPNYDPTSPSHDSHSPSYNPHSPIYDPPSPGCYGTPSPGCYTTPSPSSAIPSPSYNPPSSNYNPPSPSYDEPSPSYDEPSPNYDEPSPSYNPPSPNYNPPSPSYDEPSPNYNPPSPNYNPPSPSCDQPSPNYNPPSPSYDQPSPNYNPPSPSYDQLSPNYNPPSPSYDQLSPNRNPSYSPLSPRYSPHSPSHSPLSPGYDSPTPGYDTPSPGCFDLFSPSCYSVPSPGCYDTPSPSYDPPSPSYDPPSPSTYNPPSPTYDPPSPNLSYDPTRSDSGAPTSVYDPPSPSCYISPSSSDPPSPSSSNETLSASATLVPSPQKSLSPLSPSVSPSKMSSQSSARSSSGVSNGSSASSSKFSTHTSSCTKPCSSKSSTSSKHSRSSVSSYSSTECRTPDVSPGASPISQSSPTSFSPSANNSSINRNVSASNSSPEFTVRGCSPLDSTLPKNSSSAPSEDCNIENNAKSTVSSGGIASSPSSMDGIASSPSSIVGIASSPSSSDGIASSPSSSDGIASSTSSSDDIASSPSSMDGIASSPSSMDGIASSPSSSDGIASSPSSIVGIASSPSSIVGIASSPSSIVGIASSSSSFVGIASSPSSLVGIASPPSPIVGIASSPSLNQSPQSIVNAESSSTSNCSQLPDGRMQMSSSQTKTSGATEPSLPLPSTISNRRSKRKFWEHEIDHVKKLKTENGKIRLICTEVEYIKQNNENRKDLTHIGCSILCVDKSGSLYQEGSFFRVIESPRMKDYLSMKMKGDLLKSLHIQQNETGHFEFRDEFEIIDDQNKLIECVNEDKALEDFNDFISKFHPYVIVSLDEDIVKIILAKIQGISNISPFARSPRISWTQILRQLNVSREDIVMDFEDWFIKNMNPQDNTISPHPHALDISTMLMKAIKHVAIKKNGDFYQTLSATSFQSIESLRSSTNAAICSEKFEYVELFNSLRPNMTTTIYFESVDLIDLSSDSDDDQAKVTPISWSILSNANQNTTQSWSRPQFNFPAHSGLQVSPWASGYYTGGNLPIRHDDYFSNANLQARLINRNAQASFPGYLTNGHGSHQGAGPFYPQQNFAQMASYIPQNQNTPWSAYSRPLPSRATVPNQTSNENGAAVPREGTPLDPSQCINLKKRFTNRACDNRRKMSCAFKMCGTCCKHEKRNEPCSGHRRG